jgi:molybdopterin-guanine dinucleotide biosynthesis protein A
MGRDKSLLPYKGLPLVMYAVNTLHRLTTSVVISGSQGDFAFTGCPSWPDELAVQAPMVGIYSCLKRSDTPWTAFLSCDMPMADYRLFEYLFGFTEGNQLVWPVHSGGIEPLCGLYNRSLLPLLEELIGREEFSLRKMAARVPCREVWVGPEQDFFTPQLFMNINTPEDFELLPE